ncbi:alpha/beta hydrolase family protein [Kitasatospora sp. NBC_01539]|uniref:alpha/beta hydrolase family protein n=1 Tax=Kitasatospora sp. NBC_01539 TaxID=2903577 RepID=UPI0038602D57
MHLTVTRSRHDPDGPAPAVLVLPGHAYGGPARTDPAPAVDALTRLGLHAFTLDTPGLPGRHPEPLTRARHALEFIRAGDRVPVDPARVAVLGFGDGGHLAALLATGPHPPDLAILHGPLISLAHHPHHGSTERLLGPHPSITDRRTLSAENLVRERTSPTFLWHPADSAVLPVTHSLRYAQELARNAIDFEFHIAPTDVRGDAQTDWLAACTRWLTRRGWPPRADTRPDAPADRGDRARRPATVRSTPPASGDPAPGRTRLHLR